MDGKNLKFIEIKTCGIKSEAIIDGTYRAPESTNAVKEDGKMIHLHPYCEIFFVSDSPMKLVTENDVYYFSNSAVILPSGLKHYSVRSPGSYRFFLSEPGSGKSCLLEKLFGITGAPRIYSAPASKTTFIYLDELYRCMSACGYAQEQIPHLLSLILLNAAEIFASGEKEKKERNFASRGNEYAFRIDSIISRCFSEKITLASVAEELFLSEKQTARIISMCYGTTLSRLIADKKTSAAAMLLKKTDKPVSEIIRELNFGTECYFYSLFRKKYGCTPLAYRKSESRPAELAGKSGDGGKI